MNNLKSTEDFFANYSQRLQAILTESHWTAVARLAQDIKACWKANKRLFICGNGGSAANAMHLANDFLYGIARHSRGLRVQALSANSAVLTCLANDVGYDRIFAEQLAVQAEAGDFLIVLSGSGNSPNICAVLEQAKILGVKSYAILGFSGGKSKLLADDVIHFPINDMQIAEDLQLMVGHMIMQWLCATSAENKQEKEAVYAEAVSYR